MSNDIILRQQLVKLFTSCEAHADYEAAVGAMPFELQGVVPAGTEHSAWQLLEHLRITLWDILEFSRNSKHESPKWPEGYWPKTASPPDKGAWKTSVDAFLKDRQAICDLVFDESINLFAKIPHGDGQTLLREALLVADHNAYHLGQLILVRKMLGAWK